MALGHDFHSAKGFHSSLRQGTEVPDSLRDGYRIPPTWVELRKLFDEVAIPLDRCFFTYAYMGLRASDKTTGRFAGSKDPGFLERCQALFLRQVEEQEPSLILALGVWTPAFLAPLSPQLRIWSRKRTMRALDDGGPVVHGVVFNGLAGLPCTVAILTHPSLRGSNVGRRVYSGQEGHLAEVALLRYALRLSMKEGV